MTSLSHVADAHGKPASQFYLKHTNRIFRDTRKTRHSSPPTIVPVYTCHIVAVTSDTDNTEFLLCQF
eukprot:scaffold21803_cov81-Skeletonema_dohrnii-CCMP3373.AAC.1